MRPISVHAAAQTAMSRHPTPSLISRSRSTADVRLSDLNVGAMARLLRTPTDGEVSRLLRAIGLTLTARFRLCQNGDPCIIQVRSTRIGLSRSVASEIQVVPFLDESR